VGSFVCLSGWHLTEPYHSDYSTTQGLPKFSSFQSANRSISRLPSKQQEISDIGRFSSALSTVSTTAITTVTHLGTMTTTTMPKWYPKYRDDILEHGPLPAGVTVSPGASDTLPKYQIKIQDKVRSFSHHPLTPSGRKEWGSLLAGAGEEQGSKADFVGVAHPPMVYRPSEWLWKKGNNTEVLNGAMQVAGISRPKELDAKDTEAIAKLRSTHNELYHPCDREKLGIFDQEHKNSCYARHLKRGLVIVGPELNKNGTNWSDVTHVSPARRPAVRARYSTGYQEEFPPLILGCLPTGLNTVQWFYLKPVATERFADLWKGYVQTQSSLKVHR
jgi:hypothetical protein